MLFKFNENDIFRQTIITYPSYNFMFLLDSVDNSFKVFLNNPLTTGSAASIRTDSLNLTEINVDRTGSQVIYPFIDKTSDQFWISGIDSGSYNAFKYGATNTGTYLNYKTIFRDFISDINNVYYKSLKNIWNSNRILSSDFNFDNFPTSSAFISVPKQYYGSCIRKGSVIAGVVTNNRGTFYPGSNTIRLAQDIYKDGILRVVQDGMPSSHPSSTIGTKVGYVLYDYGVLIFQSASLFDYDPNSDTVALKGAADSFLWSSGTDAVYNWKWFSDNNFCDEEQNRTYCFLKFQGTNKIENLTMMCNAPRGKLNTSINPTSIEIGSDINLTQSSQFSFCENPNINIKNVVSSTYNIDEEFSKETYISLVYIYDENKELLGTVKLANPIVKKESNNYTVKVGWDL